MAILSGTKRRLRSGANARGERLAYPHGSDLGIGSPRRRRWRTVAAEYALSGSWGKTLRLWDLESGVELRRFKGHDGGVTSVALLGDDRRALSGSWDKTLRLWNLEPASRLPCSQATL